MVNKHEKVDCFKLITIMWCMWSYNWKNYQYQWGNNIAIEKSKSKVKRVIH